MSSKKYILPESEPMMVSESPALQQQYAADLRYGMELLHKASPDDLHAMVVYISDFSRHREKDTFLKVKFDMLFDSWWNETCIYSGPNLCYDNDNYRAIKALGQQVLPYIDERARTEKEYMQRHIQWLRKGVLS